jgi:cell division protein FtsA
MTRGHVLNEVERAFVNEVLFLRTEEILEQIKVHCEPHLGHLGAGVFLTGGVSLMKGIDAVARGVFGTKVTKVGSAPVSGVTATFENPKYSTPIGLIRYAQILDSEKPFLSPLARLSRKVSEMLSAFAF